MLSSLLTIALLHWAILLVPGFNFVMLGRLAAGKSRAAAFSAVVGMTSGTLAWALLAVFGVGAVFAAHPQLRLGVQALGGVYLVYLAVRLWFSGASPTASPAGTMGRAAALRVGFTTSMLNPKIALFYGSVFATALPAQPSVMHVAAAVGLVYANSIVWHGTLALVLSHPAIQRAYLRHFSTLSRASALVVGAFGGRLMVETVREYQVG